MSNTIYVHNKIVLVYILANRHKWEFSQPHDYNVVSLVNKNFNTIYHDVFQVNKTFVRLEKKIY